MTTPFYLCRTEPINATNNTDGHHTVPTVPQTWDDQLVIRHISTL